MTFRLEPTSEGTTTPATQGHYRRRGLLVYASRSPGSQGDKADRATIPSRGQKTELGVQVVWGGSARSDTRDTSASLGCVSHPDRHDLAG